jgi:hypothetical protein
MRWIAVSKKRFFLNDADLSDFFRDSPGNLQTKDYVNIAVKRDLGSRLGSLRSMKVA